MKMDLMPSLEETWGSDNASTDCERTVLQFDGLEEVLQRSPGQVTNPKYIFILIIWCHLQLAMLGIVLWYFFPAVLLILRIINNIYLRKEQIVNIILALIL